MLEDESEFQKKIQGDRVKTPFKWTNENESYLEEILIESAFDFKAATQEFMKYINEKDNEKYYEVDEKTVQLRWTDIEIRKYRLNNPASSPDITSEDKSQKMSPFAEISRDYSRIE